MPETINDRGIVIRTREHGESDQIVTVLTKENGKVNVVAKGAKRSKKRFLNTLEPFNIIDLVMVRSRPSSMMRIDAASIVHTFPEIISRYSDYIAASLCCELTALWTREGDRCAEAYSLLAWYLSCENKSVKKNAILFFKTRLLIISGTGINYRTCSTCDRNVNECMKWSFSAKHGGFVCVGCRNGQTEIKRDIISILRYLSESSEKTIDRLKINELQSDMLWKILKEMHCYHLSAKPASYQLIDS